MKCQLYEYPQILLQWLKKQRLNISCKAKNTELKFSRNSITTTLKDNRQFFESQIIPTTGPSYPMCKYLCKKNKNSTLSFSCNIHSINNDNNFVLFAHQQNGV